MHSTKQQHKRKYNLDFSVNTKQNANEVYLMQTVSDGIYTISEK